MSNDLCAPPPQQLTCSEQLSSELAQHLNLLRTQIRPDELTAAARTALAAFTGDAVNHDLLDVARNSVATVDPLINTLAHDQSALLSSPIGASVLSATAPTGHSPTSAAALNRKQLAPTVINDLVSLWSILQQFEASATPMTRLFFLNDDVVEPQDWMKTVPDIAQAPLTASRLFHLSDYPLGRHFFSPP